MASDIIDANKKSDVIKSFLTDPSRPEIDIEVKNVALEGMQNPPYKARVDSPNGDVYPCHRFVGMAEFKLGKSPKVAS